MVEIDSKIMKKIPKDKYFWNIIVFFLLFASLLIFNLSKSINLMNVIFDIDNVTVTPFTLTSDGEHAAIQQQIVSLKKNEYYVMKAVVSGSPQIHLDLVGENYDAAEQELVIPAGTKDEYYFAGKINTQDAPKTDTYFRLFFKDVENVTIHDLELYEYGLKNQLVYFISLFLLILATGILLFLYYRSLFFYFLIVSILTFLVYLPQKHPELLQGGDNMWYMPQVMSLIVENNMDINEYVYRMDQVNKASVWEVDGKKYNSFPYGIVIVNYPLSIVTKHIYDCDLSDEMSKLKCGEKVAALNAKIFGSASVGLLFLIVFILTGSLFQSSILSFIFAFASPHFINHAGGLSSHNLSLFMIVLGIFLMLYTKKSYFSAIPIALSYIARPTSAVSVLFLSLYYFIKNQKTFIIKYLSFGIFIGILFFAYNYISYNQLFHTYYKAQLLSFTSLKTALLGHLISPNRGLFIYFPVAIFSVIGLFYAFKKSSNAFFRTVATIVLTSYLIYSTMPEWWLGNSYGPRIFAEITPYLILLLIPIWNKIISKKIPCVLFIICILWSLFVQYRGLTSVDAFTNWYSSTESGPVRAWNWNDMQIFRGLGSK